MYGIGMVGLLPVNVHMAALGDVAEHFFNQLQCGVALMVVLTADIQ